MPRRRKDLVFEESLFNNLEDYQIFKGRLFDLACGCFNFENLDENIDKPFIIRRFILEGRLLCFRDDVLDKMIIYPFTNNGKLNEYNIPIQRRVVLANNGASYNLTDKDSVILRCNVSGTSLARIIDYFARNIYLINRTIQININAQKTPVALQCNEDTRLSYQNLLKEYQGNVPVIFGSKDLDLNQMKALNMNAPLVAPQLYELMSNYWNEFLTFFGIPNVSLNKKERLITDEVQRTMGGILVSRQNFENQLKSDIDKVNKMFGTNIIFTWGVKQDSENSIDTDNTNIYNESSENFIINDTEEGGQENE